MHWASPEFHGWLFKWIGFDFGFFLFIYFYLPFVKNISKIQITSLQCRYNQCWICIWATIMWNPVGTWPVDSKCDVLVSLPSLIVRMFSCTPILLYYYYYYDKPHRAAFVVEPDFVIPRANLTKLYATTTACIGLWKYLSYLRSVFTKEETCTDGLFFYTTTFKQKGKVLSNNGKGMTWNLLFLLPAFTLILITGAYWCCQTLLFCAKV